MRWLLRARAFFSCVSQMIPACLSRYFCRFLPLIDKEQIIALAAVLIWQTVSSDFFFPILLIDFTQEEQAQARLMKPPCF